MADITDDLLGHKAAITIMKRIGIDARLIEETGVGRYIRNLIKELGEVDTENEYVVFLRKKSFDTFLPPNERWQKRLAEIPWHSLVEQIIMPFLLIREKLDLVHIPYFNVPIFYPGKFIVTIHDLTILHFDTGKASTLPLLFYKLRRFGYLVALTLGLARAQKVIAVSGETKQEIMDHFKIDQKKIVVTYEGVGDKIYKLTNKKRLIADSYFLYVGNAYPHKNLEMLVEAFQQFLQGLSLQNIKLVLVGEEDFFYRRLKKFVKKLGLTDQVIFIGVASDEDLGNLYSCAIALVFPSFMEGFGLPGLEAMAHGTPVICSDIAVFHEIYGDAACYFAIDRKEDLIAKLDEIISNTAIRKIIIEKGKLRQRRYSWTRMVEETLAIYKKSLI